MERVCVVTRLVLHEAANSGFLPTMDVNGPTPYRLKQAIIFLSRFFLTKQAVFSSAVKMFEGFVVSKFQVCFCEPEMCWFHSDLVSVVSCFRPCIQTLATLTISLVFSLDRVWSWTRRLLKHLFSCCTANSCEIWRCLCLAANDSLVC